MIELGIGRPGGGVPYDSVSKEFLDMPKEFESVITRRSIDEEHHAEFEMLMTYYKCALMHVETKVKIMREEFALERNRNPIEYHKTRLKSESSIIEKMHRRGLPVNLETMVENITDIAGLRVVCSYPQDVYNIAEYLVAQDDVTLIERKDYIAKPKPSGYRSLHLIVEVPIFIRNEKREVKVEVQLRTIAMEFWANLEHKLRYKKDLSPDLLELTSNELLECAELSAALDLRMQRIRDVLETSEEKE